MVSAADVRAVREYLAGVILPGASDTAANGTAASVGSRRVQAEWVDLLGELEALKNTVTATQARLAVALEEATKAEEARLGIRAERRGRGVPNQVGAAMQASPHAGTAFLGTARAWLTQMPHTFDALRAGVLSQWRATLLVRETSHLAPEHRAWIDEEVCGPGNRAVLARMGTRRLIARIKELAARLDVHACVRRNARAVGERRVSVRPAPDLMVYLTALVPMQQGVQAYAQLKAHAQAAKATGDERGAGQIMADTLIERVTGRGPGKADEVPVTINLLVSDETLLAGGPEPAMVVEGMPVGAGVVPAPVARNLVAQGIDADAAWLRGIYVDPHGRLLATTSTSRFHPPGLSVLLRAPEQGVCATSWCDAPVRHLDHVTPHAEGGETSLGNGQGLCVRCNHAKQSPGWRQKVTEVDGRHAVETLTPTGHILVSVAPEPPRPVRDAEPSRPPARDAQPRHVCAPVAPAPSQPVTASPQEHVSGTPQPPVPEGDAGRRRTGQPAPAWTPAIGVLGPKPGRIPRSRYSIGCTAPRPRGAIAYRPPERRGQASRWHPRRARPDLVWAHTPVGPLGPPHRTRRR
jgi:hypothetical protein